MTNGKPKVEIPAWQRASVVTVDDAVYSQPQPQQPESETENSDDAETEEQHIHVFQTADFDSFKQRQEAPTPPPSSIIAAPIITYPEFLVEAHKPRPLITPARVLNTLYVAAGISTLVYAASKHLVTPMVDDLNHSRHDFLTHSQHKVDDLNDRLSRLVSKQQPAGRPTPSDAEDDAESETSDPTELYHRDMGTQTELPPEPKSSLLKTEKEEEEEQQKKKTAVEYATNGLHILSSHISEMADASDAAAESHQNQKEKMNSLRCYLDQLLYGNHPGGGGPLWTEESIKNAYGNSGAMGGVDSSNGRKEEEDAMEELKREIRGVKGVLLSARRFPPVGRPQTAAA